MSSFVFFRNKPKDNNEQRNYENFSVSLSSYRNTIFNQSASVFSLVLISIFRVYVSPRIEYHVVVISLLVDTNF